MTVAWPSKHVRVSVIHIHNRKHCAYLLVSLNNVCSVCTKTFYAKYKFLKCSGPCATSFNLSCLQSSDTEHSHYTECGASRTSVSPVLSCYVCSVNDDKPVKTRSAYTSDVPKVISPERSLMPPPVFKSD
jgi:hypothetical protein